MITDNNITYEDYIVALTYEYHNIKFLYSADGFLVAKLNQAICRIDLERMADVTIFSPERDEFGKIYHLSELLASTPVGARGDINNLTFDNLQEVK